MLIKESCKPKRSSFWIPKSKQLFPTMVFTKTSAKDFYQTNLIAASKAYKVSVQDNL